MLKCPICNKEYENWRSLHGHMLKSHMAEYKAKDCKLSAFGIDISSAPAKKPDKKPKQEQSNSKPLKKKEPPEDFRPLDKYDPDEREAYNEGYRYYSDGAAFTSEECKQRGWI